MAGKIAGRLVDAAKRRMGSSDRGYDFSRGWFNVAKPVWNKLLPQYDLGKLLEIGSFEGASACYLIETVGNRGPVELHCVDTWEGAVEHKRWGLDMGVVEARFERNTDLARSRARHDVRLLKHKGYSDVVLPKLLAEGKAGYFDFIYIDGSHQAPDVLCDAVLAFRLLRVGGLMVFDDYLWSAGDLAEKDPIACPKPAIDAFANIYLRQVEVISAPLYQLFLKKVAD